MPHFVGVANGLLRSWRLPLAWLAVDYPRLWSGVMSVIRSEEQRPKLERMARHWPRSIQEYWSAEEERQKNLPSKLLAETIRIRSRGEHSMTKFGKRKSYVVPPHGVNY